MCFSELPGSYLSLSHSPVTGRFPPALLQQRLLYPATYSPSCHHLSRLKGEGVKGCWKYILWAMSFLSAMLLKPNLLSVPLGRSEKLFQVGTTTEEKEGALVSGTEAVKGEREGGSSTSTLWSGTDPPCPFSPAMSSPTDKLRLKMLEHSEGRTMCRAFTQFLLFSLLTFRTHPCIREGLVAWLI